jgi:hypothetical protein
MTPDERDAVLEEAAIAVEMMVDDHPHWTSEEHDGIMLAAMEIRRMTRKGAAEAEEQFSRMTMASL